MPARETPRIHDKIVSIPTIPALADNLSKYAEGSPLDGNYQHSALRALMEATGRAGEYAELEFRWIRGVEDLLCGIIRGPRWVTENYGSFGGWCEIDETEFKRALFLRGSTALDLVTLELAGPSGLSQEAKTTIATRKKRLADFRDSSIFDEYRTPPSEGIEGLRAMRYHLHDHRRTRSLLLLSPDLDFLCHGLDEFLDNPWEATGQDTRVLTRRTPRSFGDTLVVYNPERPPGPDKSGARQSTYGEFAGYENLEMWSSLQGVLFTVDEMGIPYILNKPETKRGRYILSLRDLPAQRERETDLEYQSRCLSIRSKSVDYGVINYAVLSDDPPRLPQEANLSHVINKLISPQTQHTTQEITSVLGYLEEALVALHKAYLADRTDTITLCQGTGILTETPPAEQEGENFADFLTGILGGDPGGRETLVKLCEMYRAQEGDMSEDYVVVLEKMLEA